MYTLEDGLIAVKLLPHGDQPKYEPELLAVALSLTHSLSFIFLILSCTVFQLPEHVSFWLLAFSAGFVRSWL